MSSNTRTYIFGNIKLPLNASSQEAFSVVRDKMKKAGISARDASFRIFKKSVDARNKNNIFFVYSVSVSGDLPVLNANTATRIGAIPYEDEPSLDVKYGSDELGARPVVVGTGPCGLFAALLLAENGYRPVVLERGESIEKRKIKVSEFVERGILDHNTNIQFGAGGAGTFSDGKLITRINDPASYYIMRRFVEFGAPSDILYSARPHIGTDVLSKLIENMLLKICELGGEVLYNTRYITTRSVNGVRYAVTDNSDIPYSVLLLATGHSARDTYEKLIEEDYKIEAKPFSVGMRIEHLAEQIDRAMFGSFADNPALGHAEYNLSYDTKARGVYTFCMCPGGEVVAAASEAGGVVSNGMSYHKRDGVNSNSAVVCSVFPQDYGDDPRAAIEMQRSIERKAFLAGGADYSAPIITVGDFLNERCVTEPKKVIPTYRRGKYVKLADPRSFLPTFAVDSIKRALIDFDRKIKGFSDSDAVLTGAETRTSAPLRIKRDPESRLAFGQSFIYPCGEGAGYAGGITSAAIDGIKTAMAVMRRYKPF